MRKFIVYITLLSIIMSFIPVFGDEPVVTAPTAILIDAKTGKVLYEKNADEKHFPASTTKVMTGLLAVEKGKMDEVITIGKNPPLIERGSSQIYLITDEQLTMEQLLYALMLESANDAAVAIAEHISGSVEEFAKLMNSKAKELGATNTNFVNPNGLHNDNHYTTARDMAMIAKYAMTMDMFRSVVKEVNYTIPKTNKQEERNYITNSNKLIWKTYDKFRYEYATGIKTGYTVKAKQCLVGGAIKGDMELISVVMAAEGQNIYTDTVALLEYGFANFQNVEVLKKDQIVTSVSVTESEEKINLLAAEDFSLVLSQAEREKVKTEIKTKDTIKEPIKKGEVLGAMLINVNGKEVKKVDLLSSVEIAAPQKLNSYWWLWIIAAFLLYRTAVTIYKVRQKKYKNIYIRR
ncbi:MAG TPA: D-alanyl-D-alanine carboxypeptidase family protein [Patescibacteria group bacterium]|nr:D-alanyl-D-alanine carboxypeptidase family protein [Patescibacteria group bacterium]